MTWYEKYGWNSNPFEITPMPDTIAGIKEIREEIVDYMNSGDCCLLTGEDGMGKTVVLKWLEKYTSPNTLTIYLNTLGMTVEELKKINIERNQRTSSLCFD